MQRWFSSDLHLSHGNIIKYQKRPFNDIREMDDAIRTYHNEDVKPEDHWSCLGDVTIRRGGRLDKEWFCRFIRSMHGHKRLYLGNHDHFPIQTYIDAGFEKIYGTWRDDKGVLFSHIPIHPSSFGSARANVHGHIHGNPDYPPHTVTDKDGRVVTKPYVNLSVEVTGYRPVHYDALLQMIERRKGQRDGVRT